MQNDFIQNLNQLPALAAGTTRWFERSVKHYTPAAGWSYTLYIALPV
jgi:hypothetical protein